ncbi:ABC transporter permease [Lachnoanaerobaculum sp.]|uniref:ABC transporter permease n=1 Tax=Lachnoanaerobaculum sp. TaxID=2049030 RepID=UPI0025C0EAE1|nr:ABC transporter permease [Lachnoanaerobaculum sp.]
MRAKKSINQTIGLIKWSLLRHKIYIPIFTIVQVILSLAVIYGFSFVTNSVDSLSKSYLYTGAVTINIIAVTCVLSPQIVSESKQNGIFSYEKTLDISRIQIILADLIIWALLALPGFIVSTFLGAFNFMIPIEITLLGISSVLFVIISLTLLGFAIAYVLPTNIMALITQLIMIGGLLFSPIIYPAERLPIWMGKIYNNLPFVPVSNIIRCNFFGPKNFLSRDYLVVIFWGISSYLVSIYILSRRK